MGQIALDHVRRDFAIRSGTPQVALARSINREGLLALNVAAVPRTTIEDPPLMLVIIKGDFGASNLFGLWGTSSSDESYKFVGYVFDLWSGGPTLILASASGGQFSTALNDPSLPIVATPLLPSLAGTPAPLLHYGEVAPTVAVPSEVPAAHP